MGSFLKADYNFKMNGVQVYQKILPDDKVWVDEDKAKTAGFSKGDLFKACRKLSGGTGKAQFVTIHNSEDFGWTNDDPEFYVYGTFEENMGATRVHYYVDETCAWQELRSGSGMSVADPIGSAEVAWHSGDGITADGGNETSIAIEIINSDDKTKTRFKGCCNNGAKIAAMMLFKHHLNIDSLVTHTYWVNKSLGKTYRDVDEQCTRYNGGKWCPAYIMGDANDYGKARKNWLTFKNSVKAYLDELTAKPTTDPKDSAIKLGDIVTVAKGSKYTNGKRIPNWVCEKEWIVYSVNNDTCIIDKSTDGLCSIFSSVYVADCTKVDGKSGKELPYLVKVNYALNVRKGPSYDADIVGTIVDYGVYTIVEEENGWGKLKSGFGWIKLEFTEPYGS